MTNHILKMMFDTNNSDLDHCPLLSFNFPKWLLMASAEQVIWMQEQCYGIL
jgi:hypothetical protein